MKPKAPSELTGIDNPDNEQIRAVRLEICKSCDKNNNDICMACGCYISSRTAKMEAFCPLLKW